MIVVILAAATLYSNFWQAGIIYDSGRAWTSSGSWYGWVRVRRGGVELRWERPATGFYVPQAFLFRPAFPLRADLPWAHAGTGSFSAEVPFWCMLPLALTPRITSHALRRWRGRHAGLCTQCRYSRAGLPATAPCPECGVPPVNSPR